MFTKLGLLPSFFIARNTKMRDASKLLSTSCNKTAKLLEKFLQLN